MKNSFKFNQLLYAALLAILFLTVNACSEEQVVPVSGQPGNDLQITVRTDGPVAIGKIIERVSKRDNIPIEQFLSCSYYGQTGEGYYEYHLTTLYDGPKIYIVTQIIGDEFEGY